MNKVKSSRQDLRVLQRNMIYCSGLPSNITTGQMMSNQYFGQYGKVDKIVKNPFPNRNYCSVYITYSHQFQAATAILACNEYQINRSTLWCLFGTMKYCKFFLKKIQCKNLPNCPYLHNLDPKNEVEIQASPAQAFPQHQQLAKQILRKYSQRREQLKRLKKFEGQLPDPVYALQAIGEQINSEIDQTDSVKILKETENQFQYNNQEQGNSCKSNQDNLQEKQTRNKKEKRPASLDTRLKKLIIKQLQRAKGSRLLKQIQKEQTLLRQLIINDLRE